MNFRFQPIVSMTVVSLFLTQCKLDIVKDIDGNIYTTAKIGTQVWMAENLTTTRYSNGDTIKTTPLATTDIENELVPKYQWTYNGDEKNVATYGRLYTWFVATDERNVCPDGWHVPTDSEWSELTDYLTGNGYGFGGGYREMDIAKSLSSDSLWINDETPGSPGNIKPPKYTTNFDAIPAGCRLEDGNFHKLGYYGNWWTSSEAGPSYMQILTGSLVKGSGGIVRVIYNDYQYVNSYINNKKYGLSIRCLKDKKN